VPGLPRREVIREHEFEARYSLRNTGTKAVTSKSLRTSCGCTTPHLEKET